MHGAMKVLFTPSSFKSRNSKIKQHKVMKFYKNVDIHKRQDCTLNRVPQTTSDTVWSLSQNKWFKAKSSFEECLKAYNAEYQDKGLQI